MSENKFEQPYGNENRTANKTTFCRIIHFDYYFFKHINTHKELKILI